MTLLNIFTKFFRSLFTSSSAPTVSKLLLSYKKALLKIRSGWTAENFDDAIIYFGCTKEHALNPRKARFNELDDYFSDHQEGNDALNIIAEVISKAELEGRIAWRAPKGECTYRELNSLLRKNDLPELDFGTFSQDHFNIPTVKSAVSQQLPWLTVI